MAESADPVLESETNDSQQGQAPENDNQSEINNHDEASNGQGLLGDTMTSLDVDANAADESFFSCNQTLDKNNDTLNANGEESAAVPMENGEEIDVNEEKQKEINDNNDNIAEDEPEDMIISGL